MKRKLGLVVNPIAGMGGRVGLKGTDGEAILRRAIELGAEPVAPSRAVEMLRYLSPIRGEVELITYPYEMGQNEAIASGFKPTVIGSITLGKTSAHDTEEAVGEMAELGVDLIVFVGGDGTARDICEKVDAVVPVLGVPAGVKVHSSVFAINPKAAAETTLRFIREELQLREAEVMDVDEEAFRMGRLSAKLYGYMMVPYEEHRIQATKVASPLTEDEQEHQTAIAKHIVEEVEAGCLYILGPGTTTRAIAQFMGLEKTLLGVDVAYNGKLIGRDVNEKQLLSLVEGRRSKVVVTPIGGQAYLFGRGNQQISPRVIRAVGKENIIVVATKHKLATLRPRSLLVDTGDAILDQELRGYMRVVTGYMEETVVRVE